MAGRVASWFGGGSSSSSEAQSDGGAGSAHFDAGSGDYGTSDSFGSDFASSGASYGAGAGGMSSMGAGDPQAALRAALQQEQQKAVVQAAIAKLTELCWDTCVARPEAKLSSSEQTCIANCAERYLDTSMFVMGRMTKQHQQ